MNDRDRKSVRFDPNYNANIPAGLHSSSDSDDSDAGTDTECRQNTILNAMLAEEQEDIERLPPSMSRQTQTIHAAAAGLHGGDTLGDESLAGGLMPSARQLQVEDVDPINDHYNKRIAELRAVANPDLYIQEDTHHQSEGSTGGSTQVEPDDYFSSAVNAKLEQVVQERQGNDRTVSVESIEPYTTESEGPQPHHMGGSILKRLTRTRRSGSNASTRSITSKTSSHHSISNEDKAKELANELVEQHTIGAVVATDSGALPPKVSVTPVPDEEKQEGGGGDTAGGDTGGDTAAAAAAPYSNRDYLETGANVPELGPGDEDAVYDTSYKTKTGVLGSLLKLYNNASSKSLGALTPGQTPSHTPKHTPGHTPTSSTPNALSPSNSANTSSKGKYSPGLLSPGITKTIDRAQKAGMKLVRPAFTRSRSSGECSVYKSGNSSLASLALNSLNAATHPLDSKEHRENRERKQRKKALEAQRRQIALEIADTLQRQRFLLRFARALMLYGAPSHRLEEFLYQCARIFEIDAQFLYVPGCVIVTFGDSTTHTSETLLLRVTQGLNLHKLHQSYLIYKDVVHGLAQVEAASERIDTLLSKKNTYPTWLLIIIFGLGSGFIGLFSFGGGWKELPIIFILSSIVGILQMYVAPRSTLYSNVFEISSCIFVSFFARAISSISRNGERVFCFGAIVQSSISLILPGYAILTGSLELQAKSMVSGSVRMFYAIIYSMFLTFGITLGSAVYGWMDKNATNELVCTGIPDPKWKILFVPISALCLAVINQAGRRELPVMILVACAGYTVLALLQYNISNASVFTSTLGALTIGILGNLWSRLGHGLAFTTMVPGVLVIVPGGVAAQGSLIEGVALANSIVNRTHTTGTAAVNYDATSISNLGGTMTQVAVGISVGLFLSTLCVYPLGMKSKTTGFFTF